MSKQLNSSSSSRDEESKQWFDLIDNNCSTNTKISRKLIEKRDQKLTEDRVRGERELNPYYRLDTKTGPVVDEVNPSVKSTSTATSLSLSDRNSINAKLLKAELIGNQTLVQQLRDKLNQLDNKDNDYDSHHSHHSKHPNIESKQHLYSVEKRADEESMSLKEMYLRAKQSTTDDENKKFIATTSRFSRSSQEEYEDMPTKNKKHKYESNHYVRHESEGKDKCRQCVDNIERHLIISNGEKTIISVTPYEPFVTGFCHILSKCHSNVSLIASDEDCLREMNERKHQISSFFNRNNKSVIFMETYFKRSRHFNRHFTIECIPIKSKYQSEAHIFFKKAIMECESEWALNKQLIEIKDKCVTKLIPKGLSYFWVTFGPKNIGFAHVIENEETFSPHFGKEVIAGLLDIEPNKWLNSKNQNYEQQFQRVVPFKDHWKQMFG